ncbi:thioredoxin family protein [Marinomonas ostreistagni]|uniref:Thioredoxin family protein n=1 Tax=Marinomonas ostreistagni TaxID=359209 RepID=A0ABS0ZBA0_9GAMM|nr:thioredoxin family protein [Marinomonas ostreistagni]MBJ7550236.1 thioredoxin family protein [Marinomonas ostreistagni]
MKQETKQIKVLGSGCTKCQKTAELIERIAAEQGVEVNITKETDAQVFLQYGVMSTPAVIIDEVLKHSGSIPHTDQVKGWLA